MSKENRQGKRKPREKISKQKIPKLGYYLIVTDTAETERNYLNGLRNSFPKEIQKQLVIKVIETKTRNLVNEALNVAMMYPQFCKVWIVFDRDEVQNFDEIIEQAENSGVNVGWTNPCIETWFSVYFGSMPFELNSVNCCNNFKTLFANKTGQVYKKSDVDIYRKLVQFGDEEKAIKIANDRFTQHHKEGKIKPAEMCPCTTIHLLVKEIKAKSNT